MARAGRFRRRCAAQGNCRRSADRSGSGALHGFRPVRAGPRGAGGRRRLGWAAGRGPFVFDGFPRTVGQAQAWKACWPGTAHPLTAVLWLELDDEAIAQRVSRRVTCADCGRSFQIGWHVGGHADVCPICGGKLTVRKDDDPATLTSRMEQYRAHTEPVKDFYATRGLLRVIDAGRPPEDVFAEIESGDSHRTGGGRSGMSHIPIKSPREIEKMRRAGQAASQILEKVGDFCPARRADARGGPYAAELIAEAGCTSAFLNYRKFPGNICISVNEEVVHGIGGARRDPVRRHRQVRHWRVQGRLGGGQRQDGRRGNHHPDTARLLEVTEARAGTRHSPSRGRATGCTRFPAPSRTTS